MTAEPELHGPTAKKSKTDIFSLKLCIFCNGPFTDKAPETTPNILKLQSLFTACRHRLDDVGKQILSQEQNILSGHVSFRSIDTVGAHIQSNTILKGFYQRMLH